jgi:hypothetical protein
VRGGLRSHRVVPLWWCRQGELCHSGGGGLRVEAGVLRCGQRPVECGQPHSPVVSAKQLVSPRQPYRRSQPCQAQPDQRGDPAARTCRSSVASVGRVAVAAPAETAVAGAAALAAALSESPQAAVKAAAGAISAAARMTDLGWGAHGSPASASPCPRDTMLRGEQTVGRPASTGAVCVLSTRGRGASQHLGPPRGRVGMRIE